MHALRLAGLLAMVVLLSSYPALPWGSATDFETHQFILRAAYAELEKDPAFKDSGFPTQDEILKREGVYYLGDGESLLFSPSYIGGPGPDRPGATDDADHYYNPNTSSGNGPGAASRQYRYLAKGIVLGNVDEAVKKGAAWGAHFMADMSVPYHVNGMTKKDLESIYAASGGATATAINLDTKITASLKALSYHTVFTHDANFKREADRYLAEARKPEYAYMNWFDPWYWNGATSATKGSSHIEWEVWTFHNWHGNYRLTGYSPDWKNGAPTLDNPWDAQAPQIAEVAKGAAAEALSMSDVWAEDANPALDRSIQNVLTMWRASISALRPTIKSEMQPAESGTESDTGPIFLVKGNVKNLMQNEAAANLQYRLSILSGGKFGKGDGSIQTYQGFVSSSGGDSDVGEWEIELTDTKNGAKVKIEVICPFSTMPDLGYAYKVDLVKLPSLDGSYSGDFSGGSGGSISFTIKQGAASGRFSGSYEGDPVDGTFNGTVDAMGKMRTSMKGMIHATTQDDKGDTVPWDISFAGEINGTITATGEASGDWIGRNSWGNPQGSWTAAKQ
jgi:hypothetical protein